MFFEKKVLLKKSSFFIMYETELLGFGRVYEIGKTGRINKQGRIIDLKRIMNI